MESESTKRRTFDADSRQHLHRETRTPTAKEPRRDERDQQKPGSGRVPHDADEARDIPTDISIRKQGEPDPVAQMPAAAPAMTDEEAGLGHDTSLGRIEPLRRRPSS